jgi:hypothetical protein
MGHDAGETTACAMTIGRWLLLFGFAFLAIVVARLRSMSRMIFKNRNLESLLPNRATA